MKSVLKNGSKIKPPQLKRLKIILASTVLMLLITGYYPTEPYDESNYSPVLMERTTLEESIKFYDARTLEKPGKIYIYGNMLYVNEKYKGIHVIDNSNPSSPINKGFIRVPGNIDIAVKNDILYADNAVDLIAINISDLNNLQVTSRNKNIFPELTPPDLDWMPYEYEKENRPANTVIVEWKLKNQ